MIDKFGSIIITLVMAFVSGQWGKDIAKALQVILTVVQEAENKLGKETGPAKREAAIKAFFEEVEKPGGLDLPTIITGDMGRRFVGLIIDGLVSLANGKSKN